MGNFSHHSNSMILSTKILTNLLKKKTSSSIPSKQNQKKQHIKYLYRLCCNGFCFRSPSKFNALAINCCVLLYDCHCTRSVRVSWLLSNINTPCVNYCSHCVPNKHFPINYFLSKLFFHQIFITKLISDDIC